MSDQSNRLTFCVVTPAQSYAIEFFPFNFVHDTEKEIGGHLFEEYR